MLPTSLTFDASHANPQTVTITDGIAGPYAAAKGALQVLTRSLARELAPLVREVGDLVKMAIEEQLGIPVRLTIHHKKDFRNYKVSIQKAENTLSFHPNHSVKCIVKNLIVHMEDFSDWDNPSYYNIETLKLLSANGDRLRTLVEVA